MKGFLFILAWSMASGAFAFEEIGNLKASDQKYFKNDNMEGKNKLERIDENVRAINRLFGEVEAMKVEITKLKAEIVELKAKK